MSEQPAAKRVRRATNVFNAAAQSHDDQRSPRLNDDGSPIKNIMPDHSDRVEEFQDRDA